MDGKISVFLLALSLWAVSPAWAQDPGSGQPDELQIIEFDYDHQNNPPAVNLPPTLQTPPAPPAPAASQAPAPVLAPAESPALKTAPAAKPASIPAPSTKGAQPAKASQPTKGAQPVKAAQPSSPQKPEKVITIIGEPEPTAAGQDTGAKPASGPSDEDLLNSLFGPTGQAPDVPARKTGGTASPPSGAKAPISVPVTPAGKVEKPKKAGPKTPAVSPLRPPVSSKPSSVKVERSSPPSSVKVERSSASTRAKTVKGPDGKRKAVVGTTRSPEGGPTRFFHDGAAIVGDFNPRRRAVVDPKTRPKPPAAASYPLRQGGPTRADYRHWELGTYYWSLVPAAAGFYAKPLEFAPGRPIPINQAVLPALTSQPKNYW